MLRNTSLIKSIVLLKHSFHTLSIRHWQTVIIRKMATDRETKRSYPKVAITQMRSTNNKANNMQQIEKLMEMAKKKCAAFIFLPECCDFIGENRAETLEMAESLTGPTVQRYQKLAKQYGMWMSLGGLHESILNECNEKTDKIFNAHVIINDSGKIVSVYRKLHLFDVQTPQMTFHESKLVTPGNTLVPPLTTPIGKLGLQICYDMRFAEASQLLRKAGAEILTYPSAFTYSTGKAHWETLLKCRAIENQCFVLAAAQMGEHTPKRQSWGHAMAINSWGKILVDLGEKELDVGIIEIDLSAIETVRANMPCFEHRRNDIYSLIAYGQGTTAPKTDFMFAGNIINKDTIFFETPHCFAFTNICCVVEGHVLVSTKRIVSRLKDLNSTEMSDLFNTVCYIQRMLETVYDTTAATVTVQDGPNAGQTVPHVHFHVMPRRQGDFENNDSIYLEAQARSKKQRSVEDRIHEAQKYRKALQNLKFQCNP